MRPLLERPARRPLTIGDAAPCWTPARGIGPARYGPPGANALAKAAEARAARADFKNQLKNGSVTLADALSSSNPTAPLPPEYPVDKAFFTVTFFYNETPP